MADETIADIIAEKRRRADEIERDCAEKMKRGGMTSDQYARELIADIRKEADCLEAALKRERGDCAKLREALESCLDTICRIVWIDDPVYDKGGHYLGANYAAVSRDKARAALATPPRNCDKIKTSWDVLKEWHEGLDTANDVVRLLDWLLAPATETEGGNNGNE